MPELTELGIVPLEGPRRTEPLPNCLQFQFDDEPERTEPMTTATKPQKTKPAKSPVIKSGSMVDSALRGLLAKSPHVLAGVEWWDYLATNPTDADLTKTLEHAWKLGARTADDNLPAIASTMGTMGVWVGQHTTQGNATLTGPALLNAIRTIYLPTGEEAEQLRDALQSADITKLAKMNSDEMTVAINEAFRKKTKGRGKFAVVVNDPNAGTAIWLGKDKAEGPASFSTKPVYAKPLLFAVRQLTNAAAGSVAGKPLEPETAIVISREIERKPLKWFKKSEYDTRADRPRPWVEELCEDMIRHGQLQPCLATADGSHIAGWTRVEAAGAADVVLKRMLADSELKADEAKRFKENAAKLKELDVRIVTCTPTQARRLVLIENAKRRDLNEREKCQAYCQLMDEYRAQGRLQKELAADLGLNEATLSNNLRMKSIPPEIWERHEAGGLSTDQLRKVALHADRPLFVKGFLADLNTRVKIDAQAEPHHFEQAFQKGVGAAFRPMSKDSYGGGRLFSDKAATPQELEVVEVEIHGRKQKMAGNVELWNQLNKTAKKEKKAKQAEAAANPKQETEQKKREAEAKKGQLQAAIRRTWNDATKAAIVARFTGKVSKADRELLIRLAHSCGDDYIPFNQRLQVEDITGDDETYTAACLRLIGLRFASDAYLQPEYLAAIAKWLGVDATPYWLPTVELLGLCEPEELKTFAGYFEILAAGDDQIPALLEAWEKWNKDEGGGYIPDQFYLEKPKTSKKAKAK